MHGEIDRAGQQRLFDLLREQSLAAGVSQALFIGALELIARGADDLDFDLFRYDAAGLGQRGLCLPRLNQRQRRTARADAQGACRSRGLAHNEAIIHG